MSSVNYPQVKVQTDLLEKLAVAEAQFASRQKGCTHKQMIKKLKNKVSAK